MPSAEIELKFAVEDVHAMRDRLAAEGFRITTPRTLERNTLYDTPERRLKAEGQLLRVRSYGSRWTVTHKRHPEHEETGSLYKVRIETESEVEDGSALAEVFTRLGFGPTFHYEKFRTEYEDPGHPHACLVLDETPIGVYVELEGTPDWIDRTLQRLGVSAGDCLVESYGKLFLAWKQRTGSPAEDLTFEAVAPELALAL